MCQDNFARRGKRAVHILDLLYSGVDPAARANPGFPACQEKRGRMKKCSLPRDRWEEDATEPAEDIKLVVSAEVHAELEKKLIRVEDLRQTLRHAEGSGEKLVDRQTGRFIARHRPVPVTYWIEYTIENGRYVVHRAYNHRKEVSLAS